MLTRVAIIVGLVAGSAVYWYQNPDLELKVPDGLIAQIEGQRSVSWQVPGSFAEIAATSTPKPINKTEPETRPREDGKSVRSIDSAGRVAELEQQIHAGINAARVSNGILPKLRWVDSLGMVARAHSEDMTKRGYFSHDTPEGIDPSERIDRAGYSCWKDTHYGVAENITIVLVHDSLDRMASDAVRSWMTSPGHRTNVLGKQYDRTGIGASFGRWRGYSAVYVTQVFC